jgi:hypothetical protein
MHQSRMDLHFDEDRATLAKKRAMDPVEKRLAKKREAMRTDTACRHCNVWLEGDVAWKAHQAVCKKLPPPVTFASIASFESNYHAAKALVVDQHMPTYNRDAWSGSQLICITHSYWSASRGLERRHITHALQWLMSMLNSDEGRLTGSQCEDEEMKQEEEQDPDLTVQPGEEVSAHSLPIRRSSSTRLTLSSLIVICRSCVSCVPALVVPAEARWQLRRVVCDRHPDRSRPRRRLAQHGEDEGEVARERTTDVTHGVHAEADH